MPYHSTTSHTIYPMHHNYHTIHPLHHNYHTIFPMHYNYHPIYNMHHNYQTIYPICTTTTIVPYNHLTITSIDNHMSFHTCHSYDTTAIPVAAASPETPINCVPPILLANNEPPTIHHTKDRPAKK